MVSIHSLAAGLYYNSETRVMQEWRLRFERTCNRTGEHRLREINIRAISRLSALEQGLGILGVFAAKCEGRYSYTSLGVE